MFYADTVGLYAVVRRMRQFAANPHADPASGSRRRCSRGSRRRAARSTRRQEVQHERHDPTPSSFPPRAPPLAKSWRGAFNMTHGATLGGHVVQAAHRARAARAGRGRGRDHGLRAIPRARPAATSRARSRCAPAARSPSSGMTVNRFCSSGLQTHRASPRSASSRARARCYVAGGVESISCVQNEHRTSTWRRTPGSTSTSPSIYWPMLQTAETVASRYGIPREAQDRYGVQSQQRAAAAQAAGQVQGRDRADRPCGWPAVDRDTQPSSRHAGDGRGRRGHPRRTRPTRRVSKIKPAHAGRRDRRRQREPVLRRRGRLRA